MMYTMQLIVSSAIFAGDIFILYFLSYTNYFLYIVTIFFLLYGQLQLSYYFFNKWCQSKYPMSRGETKICF